MITEISREAQLTGKAYDTYRTALIKNAITRDALVKEITVTVESLPMGEAIRAAGWYGEANAFAAYLAKKYKTTIEIAAGVISAVSPRMPWLRNKTVAETILKNIGKYADLSSADAAKAIGMALSRNVEMAVKIARGADIEKTLTGVKRRSFYNNIVDPNGNDSVTVDTWMMVAFCNVTGTDKKMAEAFVKANETAIGSGAGYIAIADAVREVASNLSMTPNAVQAVYWVAVSGSFDGGRTDIG